MKKEETQLACRCGTLSREHVPSNSVGDVVKASGFRVLLGSDGDLWYVCPCCYQSVLQICQRLIDLLGHERARRVSLTAPMIDLTKIRHVETPTR